MDRKVTREALRLMDLHQAFARATVVQSAGSVPGKVGASMLVRADGTTLGTVGGAALEEEVRRLALAALEHRVGGLHHFDLQRWKEGGLPSLCGGSVDIAVEFVGARPNVLLWGGGHVAQAIARLLPALEYDHSVADDRPDFVSADKFPFADRREVVEAGRLWEVFEPAEYTHLYLLGYDAMKDADALERSLARFPNAIGMIASASKRSHIFHALRGRGATDTSLERVRSPIGLDIGAQTPAEIAVSVVGELIREMHPSPAALEVVAGASRRRGSSMARRRPPSGGPGGSD